MMTEETYERIVAPFRRNPSLTKALSAANTWLTRFVYVCYILMGIRLLIPPQILLLPYLLVPGILFAAVSIFRSRVNAPRPYEIWGHPGLIAKDTKGKSFPSRHVFSSFVIAMAGLACVKPLGIILLVVSILLAFVRVIAGIHFIKDVAAGAAIGIIGGWIGFFFLSVH